MPPNFRMPTPEEDNAVQAGIAADPDNPELTEAQFAAMRPAREVLPGVVADHARRTRGPQKRPTKELISLRLDRDVVEALRASCEGWQSRAGELLRKAVLSK